MNKKLYIPYLKYFGFLLRYIENKIKKKMFHIWVEWTVVLLITTAYAPRTAAVTVDCVLIWSRRFLVMTW